MLLQCSNAHPKVACSAHAELVPLRSAPLRRLLEKFVKTGLSQEQHGLLMAECDVAAPELSTVLSCIKHQRVRMSVSASLLVSTCRHRHCIVLMLTTCQQIASLQI